MSGNRASPTLFSPEVRPRVVKLLDLTLLTLESGKVDRSAIDAWGGSRLEARNPEAGFFELLREVRGRSLTSSSTGDTSLGSDVDPAAQEGARGDYNAFCAKAPSFQSLDATDAPFVRREKEASNSALHRLEHCLLFEERSHRAAVQATIALCAGSPDGRAFTAVQHPELDHREIGGSPHDSAERIDLADDSAFCNSANGRVARHLTDRFESARDQADPNSKTRRCHRCLGSRVAGANDYNVKLGFEVLGMRHTLKIKRASALASAFPESNPCLLSFLTTAL
jgi:hypothetical protein